MPTFVHPPIISYGKERTVSTIIVSTTEGDKTLQAIIMRGCIISDDDHATRRTATLALIDHERLPIDPLEEFKESPFRRIVTGAIYTGQGFSFADIHAHAYNTRGVYVECYGV